MRSAVIAQTGGKVKLSDDMIDRRIGNGQTLRYQYQKVTGGWLAFVSGPPHHKACGACCFRSSKSRAKKALIGQLFHDYQYFGNLIFSVKVE